MRRLQFPHSMNSILFRRPGGVAFAGLFFLCAISSYAQGPLLPAKKEKEEFSEAPARKFIENLPPAAKLPRAADRSAKVPAFPPLLAPIPTWTALGPFPIPNGQTENRVDPVSGRVTAIAVHPTDPLIAYVGAAQGGLYRTLDGGRPGRS